MPLNYDDAAAFAGLDSVEKPKKKSNIDAFLESEGAAHLKPVVEAIYGQESGSGRTHATSIDGARGQMQVMPATFKRLAREGESVDNPDDNMRVGIRYIKMLGDKFGNDPARIATGYFSGEGNVNPSGDTPFRFDRADGNRKTVSSYVKDVMGRIGNVVIPSAQAKEVGGLSLARQIAGGGEDNPGLALAREIAGAGAPDPVAAEPAQANEPGFLDKAKKFVGWNEGRDFKAPDGATDATFSAGIPEGQVDPKRSNSLMAGYETDTQAPSKNVSPMTESGEAKVRGMLKELPDDKLIKYGEQGGVLGQVAHQMLIERGTYRNKLAGNEVPTTTEDAQAGVNPKRWNQDRQTDSNREYLQRNKAAVMDYLTGAQRLAPEDAAVEYDRMLQQGVVPNKDGLENTRPEAGYGDVLSVGATRAKAGLGRGYMGLGEWVGDAFGIDGVSKFSSAAASGYEKDFKTAADDVLGKIPQEGFKALVAETAPSIISQVPGILAAGLATAITKNPAALEGILSAAMLTPMGAQVFGETYRDGKNAGLSLAENTAYSAGKALAEVLPEKLSLGAMFKFLGGINKGSATQIATAFLGQQATEHATEQITTVAQFLLDKAYTQPDLSLKDLEAQMVQTFKATALQAPILAAIGGGAAVAGRGGMALRDKLDPTGAAFRQLDSNIENAQFSDADKAVRDSLNPNVTDATVQVPEAQGFAPERQRPAVVAGNETRPQPVAVADDPLADAPITSPIANDLAGIEGLDPDPAIGGTPASQHNEQSLSVLATAHPDPVVRKQAASVLQQKQAESINVDPETEAFVRRATGDASATVVPETALPAATGGKSEGLTRESADVIRSLYELSGTTPVWYSASGAEGFVFPERSTKQVFLNTRKGSTTPLAVAGHEVLHSIEADSPDLFGNFRTVVDRVSNIDLSNDDGLLAYAQTYAPGVFNGKAIETMQAEGKTASQILDALIPEIGYGYTRDRVRNEFYNDVFGNRWSEPGFYKALIKELARTDTGLLQKFKNALDLVVQKVQGLQGANFAADQFLKDIEPVRQEAARVYAAYASRQGFREKIAKMTPAELLFTKKTNPDEVARDLAEQELKRREIDGAYAEREAQKKAEKEKFKEASKEAKLERAEAEAKAAGTDDGTPTTMKTALVGAKQDKQAARKQLAKEMKKAAATARGHAQVRQDVLDDNEQGLFSPARAPENRDGVIVGARPGEFDWSAANGKTPPPIQHPVQLGPKVEKLGPAVQKILSSKQAKQLIEDVFGISNLEVYPTLGQYKGKPEPSFAIYGDGMTFEAADGLSRMLGFAFAQESTIVTQPVYAGDADTWPAFYVSNGKKLTQKEIDAVREAAQEHGVDYSTSIDGRSFKFFFDGSNLEAYYEKIGQVASAAGLKNIDRVETRSQFNEAENYLTGGAGPAGRQAWVQEGSAGSSSLFGRTVDHLLVPYARAVGAEGYRFSPDLFAERFGLSPQQREYIRAALRPKAGAKLSTAGIVAGTEKLEPTKSDYRAKQPRSINTDIMFALQNRSAAFGQIEPGDYSDEAKKAISQAIADEVIHHVSRPGGKSAIGWYDAALAKAKEIYDRVFPELKTDKNKEMLFDAFLGIASQGNDVHSNSVFAGRMFHLVSREGNTISQAVQKLYGTFGGETRAIENNYHKLEELLDRNGYDRMRSLFNRKMTVGEWNAILRRDPTLFYKGQPLSVEGAARQKVNGWMVFGPKIGSFINNLHGDYSTLTADLWFSRTWNRILGFSFLHTPLQEADKYQAFKEALIAEHTKTNEPKKVSKEGKVKHWQHGQDISFSDAELDTLLADPDAMLALAGELYDFYKNGFTFSHDKKDKKNGFSTKSDLRRAAKNWIEHRQDSVAAPRNDNERAFQQDVVEEAQKIIKRKTGDMITIADIQAALWYHEKELFQMFGAGDVKAEPADYADAALKFMERYDEGDLFHVEKPSPRYILGDKGSYLNGRLSPSRSNGASSERAGGLAPEGSREVRSYGEARPGATKATGTHFSGAARNTLDGRHYGTGARGKEAARVFSAADARLRERIYFYVDAGKGVTPEQGVGSVPHSVELLNLYDGNADKWIQTKVDRTLAGDEWMNAFESAVIDAGFDGYVSDFGTQRAAVLLGRHSVPVTQGKVSSAAATPKPKAEPKRTDLPLGRMTGAEWKKLEPRATELEDDKLYYRDAIRYSPSRAQTETPEFKKWFGEWDHPKAFTSKFPADKTPPSQAMDWENNRPLVLFHATNGDFNAFETGRESVTSTTFGPVETRRHAIFTTPDVKFAESYLKKGGGQNVMPVYMDIKAPMDLRNNGAWDYVDELVKSGFENHRWPNRSDTEMWEMFDDETGEAFVAAAKKAGYDGAIMFEVNDGDQMVEVYVAFDPTQIKSAIGNNGQFDPANPDIRYSPARAVKALWLAAAQNEDLFQFPKTDAETLAGVFKDIDPGFRVTQKGVMGDMANRGVKERYVVALPGGKDAEVYIKGDGRMWVNASQLQSGRSGGVKLYAGLLAFAHNTNRKLVGDPLGVSDLATFRRTENMLSAALKYGTTDFMEPSHTQQSPAMYKDVIGHNPAVIGKFAPVKWKDGDDAHNLDQLLNVSYTNIKSLVPEIANVIYNPSTLTFEWADSARRVTEGEWTVLSGRLASGLRGRGGDTGDTGAGATAGAREAARGATLKRAALTGTVLRETSSEGARSVLDQVSQQLREHGLGELEGIAYSPARFYSQLERAIEQAPDRVFGPASQVKAWVASNAGKMGVKQDEVQWSGINEWLDLQGKAKVSKDQVVQYLKQNGVKITEVEKSGQEFDVDNPTLAAGLRVIEATDGAEGYEVLARNGKVIGVGKTESDAIYDAHSGYPEYWKDNTQYGSYVLPGGENYRELLLTLPTAKPLSGRYVVQGQGPGAKLVDTVKGFTITQGMYGRMVEEAMRMNAKEGGQPAPFKSGHWEEPNILAHVRFNDRTDADGKRVLFIEELQSDWGQEGKKKGFNGQGKYTVSKAEDGTWEVKLPSGSIEDGFRSEAAATAWANREFMESGVPVAPFVTDTKAWTGLAVKRMVAYAAENGYDKVAFVNGKQSAERYDLSKQIDSVKYTPNGDGTFNVFVLKGHEIPWSDNKATPEVLENMLGKEIAQKITSATNEGIIKGLDLKVGGEGMKTFYDKIVPQVVSDVLKKVGGGKLESVEIEGEYTTGQKEQISRAYGTGTLEDVKLAKQMKKPWVEQTGFSITPAMRERVAEGLPLFSPMRKVADAINSTLTRIDAAVDGLSNLPDQFDYLSDRYLALGKIARVDEIITEIRGTFDKMPQADKAAVYTYLTTRGAPLSMIGNPEARAMAKRVKDVINYVGDALVSRGLLDPASRAHYKDQYLPRIYLKHLMNDADWAMIGAGKKPTDMGYLKSRKDIAPEIRELVLGEVKDPSFLAANAIGRAMRDVALLDWMGKISQHNDWIYPGVFVDYRGQRVTSYWLKAEADRIEKQIPHYTPANQAKAKQLVDDMRQAASTANLDHLDHTLFKQVPDTIRYGMLRGMWLRKEIYNDIMGYSQVVNADAGWFEQVFGFGGLGTKLTQWWKFSKVALNPPGQVRNFVSNMVMLQLSGVGLHKLPFRLAQAVREISNNGPHWKIAKKYGVTESTFTAQELFRVKRDLLALERHQASPLGFLMNAGAHFLESVSDLYQFSEALGKVIKIIDEMEKGKTEAEAAIEAQKWLFDYSLVPQSVRLARAAPVGMPFLTYQVKVLPRLLEVAAKHPWRFLPWVGLLYGMQAYVASLFGADDDDMEKLKKSLPKWLQDRGHTVFLPNKDADGRLQVADVGYFFPWSFYTQVGKHLADGKPVDAGKDLAGMFSAPILGGAAMLGANYDTFTKKPIYNEADPTSYKAAAIANYAYDLMAPPFISSHGFASPMGFVDKQYGGKMVQAVTGTTNKFGDPRATAGQAVAGLLGLNFYGMDPEHTRVTNLQQLTRKVQDAELQLKSRMYDRGLSDEQRAKYMADYRDRMVELGEEAKKYAEESEVPEQLKVKKR